MNNQRRTPRRTKEVTSRRPARKQRRQAAAPPVTVSRSPFLTPERLSVRLQFTGIYDIKNVGFRDASYVFRPSSIYDVDPAIGGASSYGLAEYAQFYKKYRVFSSKISLQMTNTDLEGIIISITPSTDNPGKNMSDIGPYISNPLTKFRTIGGYQGNSAGTMSHYCTTQQIAGVTTTAEDGYSSLTTTNPLENWYWVICAAKAGVSTISNGVSMLVKIEMTVHFYDRKVLATILSAHTNVDAPDTFPPPIPVYLTTPPPETFHKPSHTIPKTVLPLREAPDQLLSRPNISAPAPTNQ